MTLTGLGQGGGRCNVKDSRPYVKDSSPGWAVWKALWRGAVPKSRHPSDTSGRRRLRAGSDADAANVSGVTTVTAVTVVPT